MKTLIFLAILIMIKLIESAVISNYSECYENNSESKTLACSSADLKQISIKFEQQDFENFNEAAKFYFNDLHRKHKINSANLTVEKVNSSSDEIILTLNCDEIKEKCSKAINEILKNFKSYDLMLLYHDAGIETSINMDLNASVQLKIFDYTPTESTDIYTEVTFNYDQEQFENIFTTEEPQLRTLSPSKVTRFQRDDHGSGLIDLESQTESNYYDDDDFQISFKAVTRYLKLPDHYVIDVELQLNWIEEFSNRTSETFKGFKKSFKTYVENSFVLSENFKGSKISVDVERISKAYDRENNFDPYAITVTFVMKTENLFVFEDDLKLSDEVNIWDEIFEFFDITELKEHLGDYDGNYELVEEVEMRIEDEENSEDENEFENLSTTTREILTAPEDVFNEVEEEKPVEIPSRAPKENLGIYCMILCLNFLY